MTPTTCDQMASNISRAGAVITYTIVERDPPLHGRGSKFFHTIGKTAQIQDEASV